MAWKLTRAFERQRQLAQNTAIIARESLWRSKWPLGPARVLLERSEGLCDQNTRSGPLWCRQYAQNSRSDPFWCRKCARKVCSSLLQCCQCTQSGCSSLLFEITIQKCWSRLYSDLSYCTLLHFAPCMYMHGFTLVYIYILFTRI